MTVPVIKKYGLPQSKVRFHLVRSMFFPAKISQEGSFWCDALVLPRPGCSLIGHCSAIRSDSFLHLLEFPLQFCAAAPLGVFQCRDTSSEWDILRKIIITLSTATFNYFIIIIYFLIITIQWIIQSVSLLHGAD